MRRQSWIAAGLAAVLAGTTFVGCSKINLWNSSQDSVAPDSSEITADAYQNRKIQISVPAGNRNPQITWETLFSNLPEDTKKKFTGFENDPAGLRVELEKRYQATIKKVTGDKQLQGILNEVGAAFGVDPVLVLAAVVGEHTFNVSLVDKAQTVAVSWAGHWALRFRSSVVGGKLLSDVIKMDAFVQKCGPESITAGRTQAEYWDCVGAVWDRGFRGKVVDGETYPSTSLKFTFFNPIGSGFTYGLGQLDPIRALMVTDLVMARTGYPVLTVEEPEKIYESIINPRTNLQFLAANVSLIIERYSKIANFDISTNPGVIATLYNLGGEKKKAGDLYARNVKALKSGSPLLLPLENYYGFFINEKESELRRIVKTWKP